MTDPMSSQKETASPQRRQRFRPERARLTGFIALLDSCALSDSALRDILLWAAEFALFRPAWNAQILREVRNAFVAQENVTAERADYLVSQICDKAFPEAEVTGFATLVPAMTSDEVYRHVIAAAVVGRAQVIITKKPDAYPPEACATYNIEAMSPDDFLCDLLDLDADRMLDVLSALSQRRVMPPKTIDDLLIALAASGCVMFAASVRKRLEGVYGKA